MTVTDFEDYRLVMRAGGLPVVTERSYYLAGLTRGVRRGPEATDRARRADLAGAIRVHHPRALVHDPVESWYAGDREPDAAEFHRLTGLAACSEVCVAWLPDRDSVVDAMVEVQLARRGGATVVAITEQRQDFLVRAFASVVLPELAAFAEWIGGWSP